MVVCQEMDNPAQLGSPQFRLLSWAPCWLTYISVGSSTDTFSRLRHFLWQFERVLRFWAAAAAPAGAEGLVPAAATLRGQRRTWMGDEASWKIRESLQV